MIEHDLDVVVVGAGISGIGAGYHLKSRCPTQRFVILEGRQDIGGTWDLFRYPGIRSDSDMYTMGFRFRPWTNPKTIADGPAILDYLRDTVVEEGIDRHIRFGHRLESATWSTELAKWILQVSESSTAKVYQYQCRFLFMCTGYYDYAAGHTPDIPGLADFAGKVVHPQHWDQSLEVDDKRIVVIGSGATAVTLVPNLAQQARHVTMLQRSPTYVVSAPDQDRVANRLREWFAPRLAYGLTRWKNIVLGMAFFGFCRRFPDRAKRLLRKGLRGELGADFDIDQHFTPRYDPWDQRMCLVPNGDLFQALRDGRASVVTDTIEQVDEQGIQLASGERLDADIIVTATGLKLKLFGNTEFRVDDQPVDFANALTYKGMMLSGLPNLAFSMGYTNASWTLKCDLTCEFVCRLLNHMDKRGFDQVSAEIGSDLIHTQPLIDLSSNYVQRAVDELPKQGHRSPWKLYQNYLLDLFTLRYKPLNDGRLRFRRRAHSAAREAELSKAA